MDGTPALSAPRPDPARSIRSLKRLSIGLTVLATTGLGGLVALGPGGSADVAMTRPDAQVASVPAVSAQDPFFDRGIAQGTRVRRSAQLPVLRSRGS